MSSAPQVDLDWAGVDLADGQASVASVNVPKDAGSGAGLRDTTYLTDEEILGIDSPSPDGGFGERARSAASTNRRDVIPSEARNPSSIDSGGDDARDGGARRDSSGKVSPLNDDAAGRVPRRSGASDEGRVAGVTEAAMPARLAALVNGPNAGTSASANGGANGSAKFDASSDPNVAAEAQALWAEHQAFRAAFSSPDEALAAATDVRTIKEIFPGGLQEARALKQGTESLREAAQSIDRIDAAIFSGDVRAQSDVVAELARANPVAFRSLVAEANKMLATLPGSASVPAGHFSQMVEMGRASLSSHDRPTLRNSGEGWGTHPPSPDDGFGGLTPGENQSARNTDQVTDQRLRGTNRDPRTTENGLPATDRGLRGTDHGLTARDQGSPATDQGAPHFDAAAYASFERSTNDVVARDVRGSITDTLVRVLPEGIADGAAKRIGDDIFQEIHRALAGDRTLSEQVGEVLRDRRFGSAEQQRVISLLAGRAKQLVPSVARRVIGEWTSSVLGTARTKSARQAAAASRVDIAAAGGSLDSMPLRALSSREVNYASMSDDEILGMV